MTLGPDIPPAGGTGTLDIYWVRVAPLADTRHRDLMRCRKIARTVPVSGKHPDWRGAAAPRAAPDLRLRGSSGVCRTGRDSRRLSAAAPDQDRAGLARMRWAQIHVMRGQHAQAADVFEGYLAQFPNGRRWEEATRLVRRAIPARA